MENAESAFAGEITVDRLHENSSPKATNEIPDSAILVSMVAEKTMINVSVTFPTMDSMSDFLNEESRNKSSEKETDPMRLDEQFVVDLNKAATEVVEIQEKNHLDGFLLVPSKSKREGTCQPELKRTEMLRWGARRKVRFVGCHREPPRLRSGLQEKESNERKLAVKRPAGTLTRQERKRKAARRERVIAGSSKDRWSKERYDAAELKLMDIMRAKGAVLGNPILRPDLRAEARKHIGDTGLLDHLLKHMAGKVDQERNERFRRRHNPDGAMEYWLERADLIELRMQAGVQDPFWAPPPGWQPGDGVFLDPASAKELKQLKEEMANLKRSSAKDLKQLKDEMANMKRDFEQLLARERQENEVDSTPTSMKKAQFHADGACSFQESSRMKRKKQLEMQLLEISNSFNALQGEFSQLWEETKKVEKKDEKPCKVVRSGFRICKPQGTFLWPNSGGSMSPQVQMQVEDLLAVPTPTSASSATSPPNPFQLPGSPAKAALPKIRTVAVSCVRPDSASQGAHNCINAWKQLFDDNGRLPRLQSVGDDGMAESGLQSQSDAVGMGTGISSSNSTIAIRSDHLAVTGQGDTAAKAWLAL